MYVNLAIRLACIFAGTGAPAPVIGLGTQAKQGKRPRECVFLWLRGGAGGDHFSVSETEKRGKKRGKEGEKEEGKKEKKRGKRGFFLIGL